MITISLETIKTGIRVTGRIDGRTAKYVDGQVGQEAAMIESVLGDVAFAHQLADGSYDMTYIRLNDAAQAAIASV